MYAINPELCTFCKSCLDECPTGAIQVTNHLARVDHALCIGCGACVEKCPVQVIRVQPAGLHKD